MEALELKRRIRRRRRTGRHVCILCEHEAFSTNRRWLDEHSGSSKTEDIVSQLQLLLSNYKVMEQRWKQHQQQRVRFTESEVFGDFAARNSHLCILCDYDIFWGERQNETIPAQIKILASFIRVLDQRERFMLQQTERGNVERLHRLQAQICLQQGQKEKKKCHHMEIPDTASVSEPPLYHTEKEGNDD